MKTSTVATKYVYERVQGIFNEVDELEVEYQLHRFLDELAHNYKVDTGELLEVEEEEEEDES